MKNTTYSSHVDFFIDKEVKRRMNEEYTGCFLTHVTHGAKIIAVLGTIFDTCIVALMVIKLVNPTIDGETLKPLSTLDTVNVSLVCLLAVLGLIVHGLIFYGLEKGKSSSFIPYLVVKAIEIACVAISEFGYLSDFLNTPIFLISGLGTGGTGVINYISTACVILIKLWFWSIIRMAYLYFKKKEESKNIKSDSSIQF